MQDTPCRPGLESASTIVSKQSNSNSKLAESTLRYLSLNNCFLYPLLVLSFSWAFCVSAEQENDNFLGLDIETLLTIKIGPSADASPKGLSDPFPGDQVAKGARAGILGSQEFAQASFNSISYTRSFIQDQQVTGVGDILRLDPVLRVARGFGNFQQVYMSRGFPIFSDDMTYNGLYGILPRQYLAAELIERVEMVRSGSAFLYGAPASTSGSFGGGINVMPKRAPKDDVREVLLGIRAQQTYGALDISERFSQERVGVRLNLANHDGESSVQGESRDLGMASLGMDMQYEDLRVSADLGYQDHRLQASTPSIHLGAGVTVPKAPSSKKQIAQSWTYSNERDYFGTLRTEYDAFPSLTAWLAIGGRVSEERSVFQAFTTILNNQGDFRANRFDVVHEDSVLTSELGLRWQFETLNIPNKLSFSIHHFKNEASNAFVVYDAFESNLYDVQEVPSGNNVIAAGGELDRPMATQRVYTHSYALADELSFLKDTLLFTIGGRYQEFDEISLGYDFGEQLWRYEDAVFSPAFSLVYKVSPQSAVFINASEGIQIGEFAPSQVMGVAVENAGQRMAPFRAQQNEIGFRFSAYDLGGSVSYYMISRKINALDDAQYYRHMDYQRHQGFEFNMFGRPDTTLKVLGGFSYVDAENRDERTVGVPQWQVNVGFEWQPQILLNSVWDVQYMYTDSLYIDQYGGSQATRNTAQWERVDLGFRFEKNIHNNQSLTFRLNVKNAFNSSYWASVGGFPGSSYLTLSEPRSILASVAYAF